ncbi:MAG TPA: DNRLRE domain-containing protein [Phycisphaerales bacterium]|nr:DNRLRE domain-containing protein [Phycisphaerales bacterium]
MLTRLVTCSARGVRAIAAFAAASALLALAHPSSAQTTVDLQASQDTTIFDIQDGQYLSNGAGQYMFAGRNSQANVRRTLLRFDLSSVPTGSTINSVTLRLNMSRSRANNDPASLHRALAAWGEGTSNAANDEGRGATPTAGDATWIHRLYSTALWSSPGGDFTSTPSASITVSGQNGPYTWTGTGLTADVQMWLDMPSMNFGWVLRGDETTDQTAMRFDTRENPTTANRPRLTVVFTPPATFGACCLPDGTCSTTTSTACAGSGGTFQGAGTSCSPNPCPQPTGACCVAGNVCQVLTAAQCAAQAGTYGGNGSSCTPNPCSGVVNVTLTATKDNTLYEVATGATPLSNGQGSGMFSGGGDSQNPTYKRRSVLAFDLSTIPSNAVVSSASLQMYLGFTQDSTARQYSLHRATADWGEGASTAGGNQVNGATALAGDATWLHRLYNSQTWATPGGDFMITPSATTTVGITAGTLHAWTGVGLASDVQSWISGGAMNAGWVLVTSDETTRRSQRRFDTSESAVPAQRPLLTLTYSLPSATGACCLPTGSCVQASLAQCNTQGGTYQGDGTLCSMVSCPIVLTPFVDALPLPGVAQPVSGVPGGAAHYEIEMLEVQQRLHRDLPMTRVWGFAGSYPGPTIEARRDQPVTVVWKNQIRVLETQQLRTTHVLPVDTCLHGPDTTGLVPVTVTHLHGGHVAPASDGYPEETFPPGGQSPVYTYPNIQPAGTVWYHDHALGITRLNVYMGLAGYYLIRDDIEDALNIPRGAYEVPLAIQDRSFNPDGSLKYHDMWMEHFFGDFALVNGKVWPYLGVDRGKYRFRVLNGSTSRSYRLALSDGATFWQIGTDLGLMPAPVALTQLTLTPGERADIVVDFAPYAPGTEVTLTNSAPAPFPNGPAGSEIPNIMKFIVGATAGDTDPLPVTLAPYQPIPDTDAVIDRPLVLRRGPVSSSCPSHMTGMWMINDLMWHDITEMPRIGTTEIWSWINRSGITHPMHMHLVAFQVLDRQDFDVVGGDIVPVGPRVPPAANEVGWKDTVQATPNQITRVIARFEDFPGLFPYHCHILEHEDHEMMRQFQVLCDAPSVVTPPQPMQVCAPATASLSVAATGDVLQYRWRVNGTPLTDGPLPSGAVVTGAATPSLVISGTTASETGDYDCLITNPCGSTTTSPVMLTILPPGDPGCGAVCDSIDFNNDGLFPDTADIDDFLSVFSGGPCSNDPSCADIDFNNDGLFPDTLDIDSLLSVFSGGPCL